MTARSHRNPHASAGPGRLASGASSGPGGSLGCAVKRRLAPVDGSAVLPNSRHMVGANRQDASLTVVCQPLSQRHASAALVARPLRTGERASVAKRGGITRPERREVSTNESWSGAAHLWAIGYADVDRASQVKEEVIRLGWNEPYLFLSDVAVVV